MVSFEAIVKDIALKDSGKYKIPPEWFEKVEEILSSNGAKYSYNQEKSLLRFYLPS
jgi:hypothetical protein